MYKGSNYGDYHGDGEDEEVASGVKRGSVEKRVGTGDVSVMEINLTAEKNYDENYEHRYDCYDNHQHAEVPVMEINLTAIEELSFEILLENQRTWR